MVSSDPTTSGTSIKPRPILATPGALELGIDLLPLLRRHVRGDWSELRANDAALLRGGRPFSGYTLPGDLADSALLVDLYNGNTPRPRFRVGERPYSPPR